MSALQSLRPPWRQSRKPRIHMRKLPICAVSSVMAGQVLTEIDTCWRWRFKACPEVKARTDLGISLGRETINLPG